MKNTHQSYSHKTALLLSLCISLVLNFIYILAFFLRHSQMATNSDIQLQIKIPLNILLLHFVANIFMAYILYTLNFYILKKGYRNNKNILISIGLSLIICIVFSFLFSNIQTSIFELKHPHRYRNGNLAQDIFIMIIVLFSAQLLHLRNQKQQTVLENQQLIAQNIRAQYEVLKNQVDPHFLFNSLNTLNSLIKMDADKAQEYVHVLSSFFRYSLQNKEITTLQEEIQFAQSYCSLMKIRYGDNLNFEFEVNNQYFDYLIMPFSLQVLLENAIKHNVISNKLPLTIHIVTTNNASVIVSNPIQPKKTKEASNGIGLANLSEQYKLMLQKEITITQSNNLFSIEIPLIKKDENKNLLEI